MSTTTAKECDWEEKEEELANGMGMNFNESNPNCVS